MRPELRVRHVLFELLGEWPIEFGSTFASGRNLLNMNKSSVLGQ
jgi:hypothetical protein